jgi:hypothetical protein
VLESKSRDFAQNSAHVQEGTEKNPASKNADFSKVSTGVHWREGSRKGKLKRGIVATCAVQA